MRSISSASDNVQALKPSTSNADELSILRNMLLGPMLERELATDVRLREMQEHIDLLENRTSDYSKVLATSIRRLHSQDKNLNAELEPEVTSGLYNCFKNQPERMADALYPILGPAVRKLVASLFQGSVDGKGTPYEVEQIFLIHKDTSVVLSQCVLCADAARDADLVSGMLDAIRSFVQEAFSLPEFDGMNSIQLGDLSIWVEWGPKAILAVVVRGMPDKDLQDHYAEVLRLIHERYEAELEAFDGNSEAFDTLDVSSIETELVDGGAKKIGSKPAISFRHIIAAAIVFMVMTANSVSDKRAWNYTLTALANEPGIVVIEQDRGWRQSTLSILRDPLAASEKTVLRRAKIDQEHATVRWFQFQSQDAEIQKRRHEVEQSGRYVYPTSSISRIDNILVEGINP